MNAVGIDVGSTTGFVIAKVGFRTIPKILSSTNFLGKDLEDEDMESIITSLLFVRHSVTHAFVELPLVEPNSTTHKEMMHLRELWSRWLGLQEMHRNLIQVTYVTPGVWKNTPSKKFDVHKVQKGQSFTPSEHEKDAARLLHWYSFYGLRNTSPT